MDSGYARIHGLLSHVILSFRTYCFIASDQVRDHHREAQSVFRKKNRRVELCMLQPCHVDLLVCIESFQDCFVGRGIYFGLFSATHMSCENPNTMCK